MSIQTPWGESQYTTPIIRGIRSVSTASHGGVMVSKRLAEKRLPQAALKLAIKYGNCYCFEEDIDWRWVAIAIPEAGEKLASISYNELVRSTARDAVEYGYQKTYLAVCAISGVGEDTARKYMREYVENDAVEKVRKGILQYADEYDQTGKKGWIDYVHEGVYGVAKLFRERGISSSSMREEIFTVGKELLNGGAIMMLENDIFRKYHWNISRQFIPVHLFEAV